VARFLIGAVQKGFPAGAEIRFGQVNGLPGLIIHAPDGSAQTVAIEFDDDRIRAIYAVRNPDKLKHLAG
jgi:RNA polymerase sigma-70 factor (ECF subfamily)